MPYLKSNLHLECDYMMLEKNKKKIEKEEYAIKSLIRNERIMKISKVIYIKSNLMEMKSRNHEDRREKKNKKMNIIREKLFFHQLFFCSVTLNSCAGRRERVGEIVDD